MEFTNKMKSYFVTLLNLNRRDSLLISLSGINWSLRAFASMQAMRLFFSNTSSDQICHASSVHFRNRQTESSDHVVRFPLGGISFILQKEAFFVN